MQPGFTRPEFIENNSAEEIHKRMMKNLPPDIDDMPGGFPYDFTMPAALEKDEFINYHLVRALMIAFPEYAYGSWLNLHGRQVNVIRHPAGHSSGMIKVTGAKGAVIKAGTIFCTASTDARPSIEFAADEESVIGEDGTAEIRVTARVAGTYSNVDANTVTLMHRPDRLVRAVTNPEKITGGTEAESDDDYYDRIAAEYGSSMTYLGNDTDYIRWAKAAGAGDCIVVPVAEGPGTVKLVLVDRNGQPANGKLLEDVYNYIVSPDDRRKRVLPTACAKLICVPVTMVRVEYTCTGLQYEDSVDIERIKEEFERLVRPVYETVKKEGILRYNDVRPVISEIEGVVDFDEFFLNGGMENIRLGREEYPETGILDFS